MNNVSKAFYFGSYLAATLLAASFSIGALIAGEGKIEEEHWPFTILVGLIGLYASVILVILIYKMWKAIPAANARTTPGKAVGFLFIPFFGLYWVFPALWGWSQDWNSYAAKSEGRLQRISEGLALSIAIFWASSCSIGTIASFAGAPWLGTVLNAPNYVLIPIFIFQVCDLLNTGPATLDQGVVSAPGDPQQTGKRPLAVASLVLGILSIFLPFILLSLVPYLRLACCILESTLVCCILGLACGIVAIVLANKQHRVFREPLSMAGLITGIMGTALWGLMVAIQLVPLSFWVRM